MKHVALYIINSMFTLHLSQGPSSFLFKNNILYSAPKETIAIHRDKTGKSNFKSILLSEKGAQCTEKSIDLYGSLHSWGRLPWTEMFCYF